MAWQNDDGFLLVFCTYYGRRFYISSNKMKIFMSAERANELWADNRRNVMSCFIEEESTAEVTNTESVLITHPSSQIKYQFCNQTEETIAALENGLNMSKSSLSPSSQSTLSSLSSLGSSKASSSSAAPPSSAILLQDALLSSGMTEHVIQVVDTHKNHYMCSANITLYTSVCGKFRTEFVRLLPVIAQHPASFSSSSPSSASSSSSFSSQVPLGRATMYASDAVTFCNDHGFQQVAENNNLLMYDNDMDLNRTSFDDGQFASQAAASSTRSGGTTKAVDNDNSIDALWDIFAEQIAAHTSGSSGDNDISRKDFL
jgi:hypothetical protein